MPLRFQDKVVLITGGASVHAIETSPLVATYTAAKAAMLSLTRSSSLEGKLKGI